MNVHALRARLLLAQQRLEEAVDEVSLEYEECPSPAMYAEYLATRALALATIGNASSAHSAAVEATALSKAIEAQVLAEAALARAAVGTDAADSAARALLAVASKLRSWDGVVCALRASPDLMRQVATLSPHRTRLTLLLDRSHDATLARSVGLVQGMTASRGGLLSRRELEVLDLLREGLKTREIAKVLFIAEGTVKVHVQHIRERLGARNRAEAVARYADLTDPDASTGGDDDPERSGTP